MSRLLGWAATDVSARQKHINNSVLKDLDLLLFKCFTV